MDTNLLDQNENDVYDPVSLREYELSRSVPGMRIYPTVVPVRPHHFMLISGTGAENGREEIAHDVVWLYNTCSGHWDKYVIASDTAYPTGVKWSGGVVIQNVLYLFIHKTHPKRHNELWMLKRPANSASDVWEKVTFETQGEQPSPRMDGRVWEHGRKLWTFGGIGKDHTGYLFKQGEFNRGYNNQLLCFDPASRKWYNPECFGDVPSPRCDFAVTVAGDEVWLYGGQAPSGNTLCKAIDPPDLYKLNMNSSRLRWTRIQQKPNSLWPKFSEGATLTAVNNSLVLHGNYGEDDVIAETWLFSPSLSTWSLYSSRIGVSRSAHAACLGLSDSNSVLVLGGSIIGPDDDDYYDDYYDDDDDDTLLEKYYVHHIQLQPSSLTDLALKVVYRHRHTLDWNILPFNLIDKLFSSPR